MTEETKELIVKLVDSVLYNTTMNYVSGHNAGVSDTYECSQCGADIRCRDVEGNASLNDVDHDTNCAYKIANKILAEIE